MSDRDDDTGPDDETGPDDDIGTTRRADLSAIDFDSLRFVDELFDGRAFDQESGAPREGAKVVRSYRLPVELDAWLGAQARERGITNSDLVRELLEQARGTVEAPDRTISLADAIRALSGVRGTARE